MIIASCRKNFTSTRRFAYALQLRETPDPDDPTTYEELTFETLKAKANGKHVCILVHGYNNTLANVLEAYGELQSGMDTAGLLGPAGYGLLIGFAWPGWGSGAGYFLARSAAGRAGSYLHRLIDHLRPDAASIDIETHSLGARVALAALKNRRAVLVDNLLLTAPAVDCTVLQPGREFHSSLDACNRCFVYHSRKDDVLRKAYPLGDLADGIQKALGLTGPRNKKLTLAACPNEYVLDCTGCVPDHGGYRRAEPVYDHWGEIFSGSPLPRYETL